MQISILHVCARALDPLRCLHGQVAADRTNLTSPRQSDLYFYLFLGVSCSLWNTLAAISSWHPSMTAGRLPKCNVRCAATIAPSPVPRQPAATGKVGPKSKIYKYSVKRSLFLAVSPTFEDLCSKAFIRSARLEAWEQLKIAAAGQACFDTDREDSGQAFAISKGLSWRQHLD